MGQQTSSTLYIPDIPFRQYIGDKYNCTAHTCLILYIFCPECIAEDLIVTITKFKFLIVQNSLQFINCIL